MKKTRFSPGEIVEVRSAQKIKGYVRVIQKDKFGLLLQLIGKKLTAPSTAMPVAYVNDHSIPKTWIVAGSEPIKPANLKIPSFFFGSSATIWTIETPEGRRFVPATEISFGELKRKGYVHQVLWLAKNIEAYFDGEPLDWPRPI
jgi:hypothetical protein